MFSYALDTGIHFAYKEMQVVKQKQCVDLPHALLEHRVTPGLADD